MARTATAAKATPAKANGRRVAKAAPAKAASAAPSTNGVSTQATRAAKIAKAPAKAPSKSVTTTSAPPTGRVYVVFRESDGARTTLGVHRSLGSARKLGKSQVPYIPGVTAGVPVEDGSWRKAEDGKSWRMPVTAGVSGVAAVVEVHKISE